MSRAASRKETQAKRRVWAALLMGVFPGLGQLYNGLPGRALMAALLVLAGQAVILGAALAPPVTQTIGFLHLGLLGLCLLLVLAIMLDAVTGAWRSGGITLRWFNHPAIYLALAVGWIVEIQVFGWMDFTFSASITYPTTAGSMEPTLVRGDFVFGYKGFYGENAVSRGDVVSFGKPGDEDEIYLLRIIGLPGDEVRVEDGLLMLNGLAVSRQAIEQPADDVGGRKAFSTHRETLPDGASYLISEQLDAAGFADNTPPYSVPEGAVFLLGDNRDKATDSRIFGPIPIKQLESRLTFIFWSRDDSRIGIMVQPDG
jgi:signal peptidase I